MSRKKEVIRSLIVLLFPLPAGASARAPSPLLTELTGWRSAPCSRFARPLPVLWNSPPNRRYTFQSANNVPRAMALVFAFYCVFTPLSTFLGSFLADTLGWNEYLVTILNMAANFILEYLYDRLVVFRGSIDTNSRARNK